MSTENMKYPDPSNESLVRMQKLLAAAQDPNEGRPVGPDAAQAQFEFLCSKYRSPEQRERFARDLLKSYDVDPDESAQVKVEAAMAPGRAAASSLPAEKTAGAETTRTERRPRNRPGAVHTKRGQPYLPNGGGFYRMPNDFAETLLAVMPGPVLKAYVYAHRLARIDGTFYISHGTMAAKIGAKTTRHGQRVMARLQEAGLLRLTDRGSARSRTANTYQLVPLDQLDPEAVQKTLALPLAPHRQRGAIGPVCR